MSTEKIRIELTKEQQQQIKDAVGQNVDALEVQPTELEQRVAPYLTFQLTDAHISSIKF